ncbi:hypothetical protein [Frigoriflavimonas asaccharolytica]|uniref:Uncharacterized protein n=1 Tax=Frigoriflavimonas asaccharolytica TaxID=2735899 RepID=A0A8J8G9J5_9FLAO|nr:hypothetical protein [Frigoriflavimonas asaccharolytica]NRS91750.1 hypothetical protein [Frigoriflavimonas asaccharolytica]
MKKIILSFVLISFSILMNAQYGSLDAILTKLEQRKGINQPLVKQDISRKKFILIEEFPDHTERSFVIINGKNLTYVEIFDDKKDGTSVSNVFSGDVLQTRKNIVSIRANLLEGKKIAIPITKTFFATNQDEIIYLVDINTKKRWIDEAFINQTMKKKKK